MGWMICNGGQREGTDLDHLGEGVVIWVLYGNQDKVGNHHTRFLATGGTWALFIPNLCVPMISTETSS